MFCRDKCYICDSPLRPLASPPASAQSSSTPFRDNAAAERARADAAAAEKVRADAAAAERARADAAAAERDREVDRLRFEYEKRQRTIQGLQAKILTLNHDLDQQIRYFDEYMAGDLGGPNFVDQFFENQRRLRGAIGDCESEISRAEREMAQIQRDLDTKGY